MLSSAYSNVGLQAPADLVFMPEDFTDFDFVVHPALGSEVASFSYI